MNRVRLAQNVVARVSDNVIYVYNATDPDFEFGECGRCGAEMIPTHTAEGTVYPGRCEKCGNVFWGIGQDFEDPELEWRRMRSSAGVVLRGEPK